ncbi:Cytochrome b6 [Helianthus anomalus]
MIVYCIFELLKNVPDAIPVIGSPLVKLLRGSASVGQSTLTRFYSLHTFVLPFLTK